MIRFIVIVAMLLPLPVMAEFVHPMDYDGSFKQKRFLIDYIDERVRYEYCYKTKDSCRNTTLRMKLRQNMNAFEEATQAENRTLMDAAIAHNCSDAVDECNYPSILKHYKQALSETVKKP